MRRIVSCFIPSALLCLLVFALSACQSRNGAQPFGGTGVWSSEIALGVSAKLGGCAAGDLNPETPGDEVAVVASDGRVFVLEQTNPGWRFDVAATLPGEMIQVVVGDALPDHPGLEMVCVGASKGGEDDGGPGSAWVLWRTPHGWDKREIFRDSALLHAVAIGDFLPGKAGLEVLVAGYSKKATLLKTQLHNPMGFEVAGEGVIPGNAKAALPFPGEALIADADGNLTRVVTTRSARAPFARVPVLRTFAVDKFDQPLARMNTDGANVLMCGNDGVLREISGSSLQEVYRSDDRLRGAVYADISGDEDGVERVTAGYDGDIVAIYRSGRAEVIGHDDQKFHHLCAVKLANGSEGVAGCGYAGRVVVVSRVPRVGVMP